MSQRSYELKTLIQVHGFNKELAHLQSLSGPLSVQPAYSSTHAATDFLSLAQNISTTMVWSPSIEQYNIWQHPTVDKRLPWIERVEKTSQFFWCERISHCRKICDFLWKKKVFRHWKKFSKKSLKVSGFLYMVQVGSQKIFITMLSFSFHILLIAKFWLNQLMNDCHLSYIRKLKTKTLEKTGKARIWFMVKFFKLISNMTHNIFCFFLASKIVALWQPK
jgi:hypothetical protein